MEFETKRKGTVGIGDVQRGNQSWWTSQTMSYDWKSKVEHVKFSAEWFDEVDRRFLAGSRLISPAANPFLELMDVEHLRGKKVLEIGCGMGFHAELLASSGADLTTIDLSETSVEATRRRFAMKGLSGDIRHMDAERLDFPAETFDLVWSWGVIHHSSHTGRIVRQIERVLKPGGATKIMVYNLAGASAYITMMMRYGFGFWRNRSLDELLWQSSDGFTARYYTPDLFADLLRTFFDDVGVRVLGQEADAIPLPSVLRQHARKFVSDARQRELSHQRGGFLYAMARKTG